MIVMCLIGPGLVSVSSKNSKQGVTTDGIPHVLRRRLERLRYRGHAGTLIKMHRGIIRLPINAREIFIMLVMTFGILVGWSYIMEYVISLWHSMLVWWTTVLQLDASVEMRGYDVGSLVKINIPYLNIAAGAPGCILWVATTIITTLIFKFPLSNIPLRYLLKAIAFIQMCALFFFLVYPNDFPHMLADYHFGMMVAGLVLITLIPVLFAFTYYIFDFKLWQKLSITLLVMLYLCLFIPFQYLLHAYLIHEASLVFLPVLFFIFGLPLDILAVIALYAWAMSWQVKKDEDEEIFITSSGNTGSESNP